MNYGIASFIPGVSRRREGGNREREREEREEEEKTYGKLKKREQRTKRYKEPRQVR